ncbi:MAG: kynureninase [Ginsengibacter sp.]
MLYINSPEFAKALDNNDELKDYRNKFYIPLINGKESIYFTGNSLGLQPKTTQEYILKELENWANFGVEGHFYIKNPWYSYHDFFPYKLSKIVGCKPDEIVVMNQLTVNIHLLLASFYMPSKYKFKIICEAKAFPSDQYAMASQVKFHGLDPEDSIIEIFPRNDEYTLRTEDILDAIEENKNEVALVFFGGINYYTGQVLDMAAITQAAHKAGAYCGFDLAHAAGNVELKLHDWNVDFACWCSYKYLNSGPGGIAGAFINERFVNDTTHQRLTGWWGYEKETRFKMEKDFKPIQTAEGWQLSNPSILDMASHRAAIDIFDEAGFSNLLKKSKYLTGFALYILEEINQSCGSELIKIITPLDEDEHGCQVSMLINKNGKQIFENLKANGVLGDWREPNVIRIAPVPLYNSYEDVYRFGNILSNLLK